MIIRVHRGTLLDLYDKRQADGGFATALSALSGEELGLALLTQYLSGKSHKASILPGVPTTGMKKGYRLDGWLNVDGALMQVEVKNWGANAIGGRVHDGDATAGWRQFVAWFKDPGLRKSLYPMKPPQGYTNVQSAAVCMWPVMHMNGESEPWFSVPVEALPPLEFDTPFSHLQIFSMSSYLHGLDVEWLELPMPVTYKRLERLRSLFLK